MSAAHTENASHTGSAQSEGPQSGNAQSGGPGIRVELVYAEADRALVKHLELNSNATLEDALRAAGQDPLFACVDLMTAPTGIFGLSAPPQHPLKDGDRIEIYRPLTADPKADRRARASALNKCGRS